MNNAITNSSQIPEMEFGFFRFQTLRISQSTVEFLRYNVKSAEDRARMISIMNVLCHETSGSWDYTAKRNIKNYLRENIIPNQIKLNNILEEMKTLGLICLDCKEISYWKKPVYTMQIELNFQDKSFYTFKPEHSESLFLAEIELRKIKVKANRWNDGQITLPRSILNSIEPSTNISKDFIELMRRRQEGEDVKSVVSRSKCGRYFSTFSNIPKEIRNQLIDNNTGYNLGCLDNKASQVSFLISYLRNCTRNTAKNEMINELDRLEEIQITSSFHDFLTSEINKSQYVTREAIKMLVMKLLFGDWRLHDLAVLYSKTASKDEQLKIFGKEAVQCFEDNKWNIIEVWNLCVMCFKYNFPNVYQYMIGIMKRKNTNSVADITQKLEANWMEDLTCKLKVLKNNLKRFGRDLQYFTLHDAVYFSPDYFELVKNIFLQNNTDWEHHSNLKVRVHEYCPKNVASLLPSAFNDLLVSSKLVSSKTLKSHMQIEEEEKKRDTPYTCDVESLEDTNLSDTNDVKSKNDTTQLADEVDRPSLTRKVQSHIRINKKGLYEIKIKDRPYRSKTIEGLYEKLKAAGINDQFELK